MAWSLTAIAPAPVAEWLSGKTLRERRIVAAIALLAAAVLLWVALWQPLVRDREAMRVAHAGNMAALATARRITEEGVALARTAAPPASSDARANLERILAQQGLRPAVTQLEWQDGRARVVFAAVGYDALIVALEALQRDARLRAAEATLTARVEPGIVRAELTLAR
jgi:general secretion pathway protein M